MSAINPTPQPVTSDGYYFQPEFETLPRGELAELQRERLKKMLRHAYDNVAHYRTGFDAAGVTPDDFRELADLARFPFTVKDDLRNAYPFGMFAVPREELVRVHASSGTTGKRRWSAIRAGTSTCGLI